LNRAATAQSTARAVIAPNKVAGAAVVDGKAGAEEGVREAEEAEATATGIAAGTKLGISLADWNPPFPPRGLTAFLPAGYVPIVVWPPTSLASILLRRVRAWSRS
jgi:hypothetical protein